LIYEETNIIRLCEPDLSVQHVCARSLERTIHKVNAANCRILIWCWQHMDAAKGYFTRIRNNCRGELV